MTITHVAALQLSGADGNRQHMVALPNAQVWRRTITNGRRTQWRHANITDQPIWTQGYVDIAAANDRAPLHISAGMLLLEVTDDEAARLVDDVSFPGALNDRLNDVVNAIEADPGSHTPTPADKVQDWTQAWLTAHSREDTDWLSANTHDAGKVTAAAPTPKVKRPAPAVVDTNPLGWSYPPIVDGYVTRTNGEKYKTRTLEGKVDVEMLREARWYGDHVFLPGEPGTGKTVLAEAAFGSDLITMLGTESTEEADYVGSYVVRGQDDYVWSDGPLVQAMERGVPILVDEGCVIDPRTNVILYSAMDGRGAHRRGELLVKMNPARGLITAQPGFMVIVATNPKAPGVRISEALLSRCSLIIEVGTDYKMLRTLGVPDEACNVAESLAAKVKLGELSYAPQARELLRFRDQVTRYGKEVALRNLIAAAPEGDDRADMAETIRRVFGGSTLREPLAL